MAKYIYQRKNWTNFTWENKVINVVFGEVRHIQGKIAGQMSSLGFSIQEETNVTTLTLDIVKSSQIEGEQLNYDHVRLSIVRRLGLVVGGLVASVSIVGGVVEMMVVAF